MAKPFTKRVLYDLLYTARKKSTSIYVALGGGRNPADLDPNMEPGRENDHLFMYLLQRITSDGVTTKEKLVAALRSKGVKKGGLANELETDQTIPNGSVLTTEYLQYLAGVLQATVENVSHLADQLEVDLGPGTVNQDNAYDIMLEEITENNVVTPAELADALRSVGEGHLAKRIEKEYGVVREVNPTVNQPEQEGAHEDQDGVQLPPQPAPPQASQAQTSPHDQARVSLKTPIQGRPPPAPTQASQAQSVSPQTSQPQPAPPQPSQTQPSPQVSHIVQPAHPNPIQSAPVTGSCRDKCNCRCLSVFIIIGVILGFFIILAVVLGAVFGSQQNIEQ